MLWPPPFTLSSRPRSRAKSTAAATSRAEVGWTTSAGRWPTMPFQSASRRPSPRHPAGATSTGGEVVERPTSADERRAAVDVAAALRSCRGSCRAAPPRAARSAPTNASGRSIGGSSAGVLDDVQRPAVAVARVLGDRERDARSWRPQISVVGTAIRASSAGPGSASRRALHERRRARPLAVRARSRL